MPFVIVRGFGVRSRILSKGFGPDFWGKIIKMIHAVSRITTVLTLISRGRE
jgi:hypothetical protein